MVNYVCPRCHQLFTKKSTYDYHVNKRKRSCLEQAAMLKKNNQPPPKPEVFTCQFCDKTFTRKDSLLRHSSQYCKPPYEKILEIQQRQQAEEEERKKREEKEEKEKEKEEEEKKKVEETEEFDEEDDNDFFCFFI